MTVLENIEDVKLQTFRRLGYFLGSFDPLHNGHIYVVNQVLKEGLCDHVLVYCVRGISSYKQRSDFFSRTQNCEKIFSKIDNALVSYLSPIQLQKKITREENGFAVPKFDTLKISGIIGSDIAIELTNTNADNSIEKSRRERQLDFMRGILIKDDTDSVSCSTVIPVNDFIVALRNNDSANDIPNIVCGRNVRSIISSGEHRFASSSIIRKDTFYKL